MHQEIIYILKDSQILEVFESTLVKDLNKIFGCLIKFSKNNFQIPDYAYKKERDQYNGTIILNELARKSSLTRGKSLFITDKDIYTSGLNYIFGQAEKPGRYCLISLYRLNPKFYNKKTNNKLFYNRLLREAVHELGHTFGLDHCRDNKCVMHFSCNIKEVDSKNNVFCKKCSQLYYYSNY